VNPQVNGGTASVPAGVPTDGNCPERIAASAVSRLNCTWDSLVSAELDTQRLPGVPLTSKLALNARSRGQTELKSPNSMVLRDGLFYGLSVVTQSFRERAIFLWCRAVGRDKLSITFLSPE